MKSVLVPLDGSEAAEAVLPFLEQVCSPGDTVVLLSVQHPENPERIGATPGGVVRGGFNGPSGGVLGVATPEVSIFAETKDQVGERQINEAQGYLHSLASRLRNTAEVRSEVLLANNPADEIVRYAHRMKPTFIVMRSRTRPGLTERFFGGVIGRVLQAEVAPVLLVPR